MSKYKAGDVAALFSTPKEPTTEAGKKLQSLFKDFYSKNKSISQSQDVNEKKSKSKNEDDGNQKTFKKNKKRKISDTFDQELSLNEGQKKVKMIDSQKVESKNKEKKNENFLEEKEFPRKKKKASKLNFLNPGTFKNSEINGNFENEVKSADTSELNISPKGKKVKSGFIKKCKKEMYEAGQSKKHKVSSEAFDNNDELLKEDGECIKSNSKKSKKKKLNNRDFGKDNLDQSKKHEVDSETFDDKSLKTEVEEFIKSNSKKSKKKTHNHEDFNTDKLQFVDNFVNDQKSEPISDCKSSPKDTAQVSGFIRRPKNRNKNMNSNFESVNEKSSISKKNTFSNSDTLFKDEDENHFQNSKKKNKKKFANMNNFEQNSPKKSFSKKEPEFMKLLEKDPGEETDQLSRTLFVGNLPVTTRLNDLKDLFSEFGEIEFIRFKGIETDKAKIFSENPPKSLNANYAADSVPGFIIFKKRESAVKALSLSGSVFKSRHITVDFAMPPGSKKLYDEKRSIFIGNLPFGVEDESVWNAFSDCGKIEGVRIVRDKETGIGKGFGYVLFSSAESRKIALSKRNLEIDKRPIRIKAVNSDKKMQKQTDESSAKIDTYKSRAIKLKKKNKNANSRKSIKKLVKKEKTLHKKKKIASLLQGSMK